METIPFFHRSSKLCTLPTKSAVASAPSTPISASVNGLCVAAGTEQSEFRLLHSSCYWPTLSLIIPANIDTACVVSHLYPSVPFHRLNGVREGKKAEEGQKLVTKVCKNWEKVTPCSSIWCKSNPDDALFSCLCVCFKKGPVISGGFLTFPHAAWTHESTNAPCQLKLQHTSNTGPCTKWCTFFFF